MINGAWVYLVQGAGLLILAALCYVSRPDVRRWQLTLGVALTPLGPLGELYFLQDYWHAPFVLPFTFGGHPFGGVGDLLFGFAMGGYSGVAVAVIANRMLLPISRCLGNSPSRRSSWRERALLTGALALLVGGGTFFLYTILQVPSIIANSVALLAAATVLVTYRRDLWWYSLLSALLSAMTLILVDGLVSLLAPNYLALYWFPYGSASWLSLLILGRVPLTEAIFAGAFGMAIGPLYPVLANAVLVKRSLPSTGGPLATSLLRTRPDADGNQQRACSDQPLVEIQHHTSAPTSTRQRPIATVEATNDANDS